MASFGLLHLGLHFCHLQHKQRRPRPCKGKRERYRKIEAGMGCLVLETIRAGVEQLTEENLEAVVTPHLPVSISGNDFLMNKLLNRLKSDVLPETRGSTGFASASVPRPAQATVELSTKMAL